MDKKLIKLAILFSCCFLTAEAKAPKGAELIEVQRGENPRPLVITPAEKVDRPMNVVPGGEPPPAPVPIRPMDVVPGQPQPGGPQPPQSSTSSTRLSDEEMERSINKDLQSDEMKAIDQKLKEDKLEASDTDRISDDI